MAVVLGLRRGGFDTQLELSQRQSEGLLETRGGWRCDVEGSVISTVFKPPDRITEAASS